jgi:hypothetical protein
MPADRIRQVNYSVLKLVQTFPDLSNNYVPKSWRKANYVQVGIQYTYDQIYTHICMYVKRSLVENQTPKLWRLIGRSMVAPPALLSPSSILPPTSSRRAVTAARKNWAIV